MIAVLFAASGWAQTNGALPSFEAASIKLNPNCPGAQGGMPAPGRLHIVCATPRSLALSAFTDGPTPQRLQVLGGPAWIDSDSYNIDAKAGNSNASMTEMYGPMLRKLLEDRFALKAHKEFQEQPIYSLTVAKNGPKLQPTKEGSCVPLDLDHALPKPEPGQPPPAFCGRIPMQKNGTRTILTAYGITLPRFAGRALLGSVDRPVFDKTGLTGMFDIHLEFSTEGTTDPLEPSIFTALEEQTGLKLIADKGPVEVLVIDHIERPSEN
jgi:uncharacterized protein (TIGR03435 family)